MFLYEQLLQAQKLNIFMLNFYALIQLSTYSMANFYASHFMPVFFNIGSAEPRGSANSLLGFLTDPQISTI